MDLVDAPLAGRDYLRVNAHVSSKEEDLLALATKYSRLLALSTLS
jgi:hypothetical protein